jgi:rod shape determining protein RodA
MRQKTSVWRYFDFYLAGAVILLSAFGVLMIRSAITGSPSYEDYAVRQAVFGTAGVITMFAIASIDYRYLTSLHWYIYAGFIVLLILVLLLGTINNAAQRWIPLGPIEFQPTEFGRSLVPLAFGQFLANRKRYMDEFSNTIITLIYFGIPLSLIFIQPNLGMTILYIIIWFSMMFIAGLPLRHFIILGVTGLIAILIVFPFLQPYQLNRVTTFLDPQSDPEQAFNVDQAVISVGSGGWWGKGYMNGTQSQLGFLRVQHTDFIFSMITEEMGFFFGSAFMIGMMGFILFRILRVATLTPDPAGRYMCAGIAGFLFFQVLVSVGMNVRLLPVTGLTFPFVSYGGSALVSLYICIGVVQSVLMRHRKQEFG